MLVDRELPNYIAGVLATTEDLDEGQPRVIVNNVDAIQFRIKVISDVPTFISPNAFVTCYGSNIPEEYGWKDDPYNDINYRKENFIKFAENKLFIFKPYVFKDRNGSIQYKVSNTEKMIIKELPEKIGLGGRLIPIPKSVEYPTFEFERRLLSGRTIGHLNYYDGMDTPSFVLNGGYIYGEFIDHKNVSNGWILESKNTSPRKLLFNPEKYKDYVINHPKIVFMDSIFCFQVLPNWLLEKGEDVDGKISYKGQENSTEKVSIVPNEQEKVESSLKSIFNEQDFITHFVSKTREELLSYEESQLINFHTSLKTGSLVVLGGMSGTGKSQLVSSYAKALGINDSNQFLMISVKPNWSDDTDLIGYLDTINNIYRPAETGLVNLLIDAEKYENQLYLVCFDEMNLARVEHYFSQFLSVLEMDRENRKLLLYNKNLKDRVYNSSQYPPEIEIGDNVLFVGTINIDESTHHFSDKVLDRSNLINFTLPENHLKTWMSLMTKNIKKSNKISIISNDNFSSWRNHDKKPYLTESEIDFLQDLHSILYRIDQNRGIGYRILVQIDNYIKNLPLTSVLKRPDAFDLQIVQRVLPKLRGSEIQLSEVLGDQDGKGEIFNLLDKYSNVSHFRNTREFLERKLKELIYHGYTS